MSYQNRDVYADMESYLEDVCDLTDEKVDFYLSTVIGVFDADISIDIFVNEDRDFGFSELVDVIRLADIKNNEEYSSNEKINAIENKLIARMRTSTSFSELTDEEFEADKSLVLGLLDNKDEDKDLLFDYLKDIEVLRVNVEHSSNTVIEVYETAFKAAFEVEPFVGVLPIVNGFGLLSIGSNDGLGVSKAIAMVSLNQIVEKGMLSLVSDDRQFEIEAILENSKPIYHPYKILEYLFGRTSTTVLNKKVYQNSGKTGNWASYVDTYLKDNIQHFLYKGLHIALSKEGITKNGGLVRDLGVNDMPLVNDTLKKIVDSMVTFVVVQELEGSKEDWASIRVKVCSPSKVLPTSDVFMNDVIKKVRGGRSNEGGDGKNIELRSDETIQEYTVSTYRHVFDPKMANIRPLFAYRVLDALQAQGKEITPSSILMGKSENGDMVISSLGSSVDLNKNLNHNIIASSRAGKGVMTLTLLAPYIAKGVPIFYADRKPDMAGLFAEYVGISDGVPNMALINGSDYRREFDYYGALNYDSPELAPLWRKNLPDYIKASSYVDIGDIVYYRFIIFSLGMLLLRLHAFGTDPELYEKLGGNDGIVVVIDEISNWQANFSTKKLTPRGDGAFFNSNYLVTEETLDAIREAEILVEKLGEQGDLKISEQTKLEKAIRDLEKLKNPLGCYYTDILHNMNASLNKLYEAQNAGFQQNEDLKSNFFIIGQNLDVNELPDGNKTFLTNKNGTVSANQGFAGTCPISQFLYNFSSDFLMGYNKDNPSYMDANKPNSKASARLTAQARNFGYFDGNRSTVMGGHQSTIDGKAKFFKPYLILNNSNEPMPLPRDLKEREAICTQPDFKYVGGVVLNCGKMWDAVRAENLAPDGQHIRKEIGFFDYLEQMSKGSLDLKANLRKSLDMGNFIVSKMGYEGSMIEFLMDLRPQWNFSAQTLVDAFNPLREDEYLRGEGRMDTFLKVYKNNPDFLGNYGIVGLSGSSSEIDNSDFDFDYQDMDEELDLISNFDEDTVYDNLDTETVENTEKPVGFVGAVAGALGINKFGRDFNYEPISTKSSALTAEELGLLNSLKAKGYNVSEPQNAKSSHNSNTPIEEVFEDLKFDYDGDSIEGFYSSYVEFTNKVTMDVVDTFGGFENIDSIAVNSGYLFVNGTLYDKKVSIQNIRNLPKDKKIQIVNGAYAQVFNFDALRYCTNLTMLQLDSLNFVYMKIRKDLNQVGNKSFSQNTFFKLIPSLEFLNIADNIYNRDDLKYEGDTIFTNQEKREKRLESLDSWGTSSVKSGWNTTQDLYSKKGFFNKALGTGVLGATVVGVAGVGIFKGVRGIAKGVGDIIKNSKDI